jgi:hypothetical protein
MSDDTATDEQIDKSHRMMFAYLAGRIPDPLKSQMRELYEREHKTHDRRYSNCAICETDFANGLMHEPTWLRNIKLVGG